MMAERPLVCLTPAVCSRAVWAELCPLATIPATNAHPTASRARRWTLNSGDATSNRRPSTLSPACWNIYKAHRKALAFPDAV